MAITTTVTRREILARVRANYTSGLSSAEASQRRNINSSDSTRGLNIVRPPLNCPKPCINHIPSMKRFRLVQPDDAEVLRDGHWVRYDYASLVVGDIVRLVEGDIIPADCAIISFGMDHDVDVSIEVDEESNGGSTNARGGEIQKDYHKEVMDIIVDSHLITGESKPKQIISSNKSLNSTTLYFGSRILQGACIVVVTATGDRVVLAKLINAGRWPPKTDVSDEMEEINQMEYSEMGIALVQQPMS